MSRFDRNWSPVDLDQLEWRRWRYRELTTVLGESIKVQKIPEEIVEGIRIVCEGAMSYGVHGEE